MTEQVIVKYLNEIFIRNVFHNTCIIGIFRNSFLYFFFYYDECVYAATGVECKTENKIETKIILSTRVRTEVNVLTSFINAIYLIDEIFCSDY